MYRQAIVTGAAGFAGCNLVEELLREGVEVWAVVRPGSPHNERLQTASSRLHLAYLDLNQENLADAFAAALEKARLTKKGAICYHLAWGGGRHDFSAQRRNISMALAVLEAAVQLGCRRFVCTGSQAEYGPKREVITEETMPRPIDSYGAAKLAACVLTRERAAELGIEWIWGRIFSLYGKYEPAERMLPDLVRTLAKGGTYQLSAATQNWDYLYSADGAKAIAALGARGKDGEIYNIANGDYHPLRVFTDKIRKELFPQGTLLYDEKVHPPFSLQPSVRKIYRDTGWMAETSFLDGVKKGYAVNMYSGLPHP